jgi:hypothetical protein
LGTRAESRFCGMDSQVAFQRRKIEEMHCSDFMGDNDICTCFS